ncbi:MAG: alpha/beta hydrolase domain-containing protein [Gemmatimonadales bacterium]
MDELGNEIGGLRNVEVRVPLATYAPWSLRVGLPGPEDELADFRGTSIPLPRDRAEKRRTGDPRPAISSLYASREAYLADVEASARELVTEGYVLAEDLVRVLDAAAARWERWAPVGR